jgi:putative membrane protein
MDHERLPQPVRGHLMIAFMHAGRPIEPHDLMTAWSFDPFVIVGLALSAYLYITGLRRLWARAGAGSGVRKWQAACFGVGLLALVFALISPLHTMGEALFSAHMAQHTLLIGVAAPLLILGRPLVPVLFALPMRWRVALGSVSRHAAIRRAGEARQ